MIYEQTYLINCTNTLSVDSVQQTPMVRYLSGLYWHSERLKRTTSNASCYSSVFCISFPRLAHRLDYSLFLNFTTPMSQVPFDVAAGRYKSLTPTTILTSSLARTNLISYNIKVNEVGPYKRRTCVLFPTFHFLILTERSLYYCVHKGPLMVHILIQMNPHYNRSSNFLNLLLLSSSNQK
jgi:hypothetical protein